MRTKLALPMLASVTIALAGCVSNPTKQELGTVGGAVIGGIVGTSIGGGSPVGTVTGAAVGGVVGNRIGKELERR